MLTACLFVASTFAPQGEARLAGRVLDLDGRPVAAAEVTLLHRPIRRHLDPAAEHRIVVQADANGTFRATLRDGCCYSAWARSAAAASHVAEGVTAGDFLELREVAGTAPLAVKVEGLDAWDEAATFRFCALVGSEHLDLVPLQRRGSELALPALPPMEYRTIEVLEAGGEVLWADRAVLGPEGAAFAMPPPTEYEVRVVDDAGAPVAAVEILSHIVNYWITQSDGVFWGDRFRALWPIRGRTDGDGRLALRVPMPAANRTLLLLARKDGYGMSIDGFDQGRPFRDGKALGGDPVAGDERKVTIALRKQEPVKVPLQLPGGVAYGAETLFLIARVQVARGNGLMGMPFNLHLPVVDGMAVLRAPLPSGADLEEAWTHLAPKIASDLQGKHGFAPPVEFWLPAAEKLLAKDAPAQLDPQRWTQLQVIAADGRPASRTIVQLRDERNLKVPGRLQRTDRLGRLLFELRGETRVSVYARDGVGGISIAADAKEPTRLVLRALRRVTGKVVDRDGKPVAGVLVAPSIRGAADGDLVANEHDGTSHMLRLDPSDRDGQFTLLLPPFAAEVGLHVSGRGVAAVDGTAFSWDPASPPTIEVTVAKQ